MRKLVLSILFLQLLSSCGQTNIDNEKPEIVIEGSSTVTTYLNRDYIDEGATASDNSGKLKRFSTTSDVDTSTVGIYYVTYEAEDYDGNITTVKREVNVEKRLPYTRTFNVIKTRESLNIVVEYFDIDNAISKSTLEIYEGDTLYFVIVFTGNYYNRELPGNNQYKDFTVKLITEYQTKEENSAEMFTEVLNVNTFPSEGRGTEENPFIVTTIDDLYDIKDNPNAYFELGSDIDFEGRSWIPIDEFHGHLDGKGYTIKNSTFEGKLYGVTYNSGFVFSNFGVIKNIKFENITSNAREIGSRNVNFGVVAGTNYNTIQNVYVQGAISYTVDMGVFIQYQNDIYMGGIAGRNVNGRISNSVSNVDVELIFSANEVEHLEIFTELKIGLGAIVGLHHIYDSPLYSTLTNNLALGNVNYEVDGLVNLIHISCEVSNSYTGTNVNVSDVYHLSNQQHPLSNYVKNNSVSIEYVELSKEWLEEKIYVETILDIDSILMSINENIGD